MTHKERAMERRKIDIRIREMDSGFLIHRHIGATQRYDEGHEEHACGSASDAVRIVAEMLDVGWTPLERSKVKTAIEPSAEFAAEAKT